MHINMKTHDPIDAEHVAAKILRLMPSRVNAPFDAACNLHDEIQCFSQRGCVPNTHLSLKNSYAPRRSPEYTISLIIEAVNPFIRLSGPSLRIISAPIDQKAL
jgi:hypothetical protein